MLRNVDQSDFDPFGDKNIIKSDRNILELPCVFLKHGAEGVLFRMVPGGDLTAKNESYSILQTLVDSLECLWSAEQKTKTKAPVIKFLEFIGSQSTISEDICVYFCARKGKRWPSMADAAKMFLEMHFAQQRETKGVFPALLNAIVPFSTCCFATMSDVKATMRAFVDDSIKLMQARRAFSRMMHVYDVSVEIHDNAVLVERKDSLAAMMHERLRKFKDIVALDRNFESASSDLNGLGAITLLFQVTVFGEHAYFGMLQKAHRLNGYRFVNDRVVL